MSSPSAPRTNRAAARTRRPCPPAAGHALESVDREHADLLGLLDRRAALREAARRARALTGADLALAGQVEDDGDTAVLRSWSGTRRTGLHNLVVPSGLGLGGKVLATERPCRVRDYMTSRRITHDFDEPIGAEGIRAMAGVPVRRSDGRVIGMIYVARREPGDIGDAAITSLCRIADAVAVAVTVADRAQAQREAEAEAERRRIAVALHDSVGAMLFTIGAQVRDLRTDTATGPGVADRLATVEQQLGEASSALRRSLAALSEAPAGRSLSSVVAGDCRAFEERTGIRTRAVTLTPLPEADPARRHALLGTVREALLNVEKHAGASSVAVTLAATEGILTAVVTDDGVGLPGDGPQSGGTDSLPTGGLGLAAAAERLQRLGGDLRVLDNDDGGLTVRIRVPCP